MLKKIEIFLRKEILKIILLFNKAEKKEYPLHLNDNSKLLVIRLNRIGDALVTTPLLQLIKQKSNCEIHLLADKKNHFVFDNNKFVNKIFVWEKGVSSSGNLIKRLNSEKYDAVIDTHDDVSTTVSLLISKLKIPNKIGFKKGNESIFTHPVNKPNPENTHVIERIIKLAEPLSADISADNLNVFYKPMDSSLKYLEEYFRKNKIGDKYLLGINISAGSSARFWGVERFRVLLNELKKFDVCPIIITAKNELQKAKEIAGSEFTVFYNESFDIFAALISKLNFLFTPDTSAVHLASAFEVPVFGIYVKFNTNNMVWYPYKSTYELVITEEENFDNLTTDEVIPKFIRFFKKAYYEKTNTEL